MHIEWKYNVYKMDCYGQKTKMMRLAATCIGEAVIAFEKIYYSQYRGPYRGRIGIADDIVIMNCEGKEEAALTSNRLLKRAKTWGNTIWCFAGDDVDAIMEGGA